MSIKMQSSQASPYYGWNDCPSNIYSAPMTPSSSSQMSTSPVVGVKKRISSSNPIVYNALNGPLPPVYRPSSRASSYAGSVHSCSTGSAHSSTASSPINGAQLDFQNYQYTQSQSQAVDAAVSPITESAPDFFNLDDNSNVDICKQNVYDLLSKPTSLSKKEFQYHYNKLTAASVLETRENVVFLNELIPIILNYYGSYDSEIINSKVVEFMMSNRNISWCASLKRIIASL